MDRYTYRAKRIDNGEWVCGGIENRVADCFIYDNRLPYDNAVRVNPQTIGQCTGMKDKNGTLIYEGDINHDGRWIKYEDGAFCLVHPQDAGDLEYMADFQTSWFEIAGNIHE